MSEQEWTAFGRWVVATLEDQGKGLRDLRDAFPVDGYLVRQILTRYAPGGRPQPRASTVAELAKLLQVSESSVRARLQGAVAAPAPTPAATASAVPSASAAPPEGLVAWAPKLEALFAGHARVKALLGTYRPPVARWPRASGARVPGVDDAVRAAADQIRPELALNQPQLLVERIEDGDPRPITFRGHDVDFAIVAALRRLGRRPAVLSASAVVCIASPALVVVHRRANLAHTTYGGCLHTLGGAFHPDMGHLASVGTDHHLHDTVVREVWEESRLRAPVDAWTGLVLEETRTGFVQYLALGVTAQYDETVVNAEGMTEYVRPEHLASTLLHERWVPAGRLAVLLWLAAGAPGFPPGPVFGGKTAEEILKEVVATAPFVHAEP
ncbi:MAG: hypothetical protein EP329_24780 [Deltaproteobacteria bacterium]|nr:MAG: hypothetical protein EP329_24780 [Deltaproteobacteria bacterium]